MLEEIQRKVELLQRKQRGEKERKWLGTDEEGANIWEEYEIEVDPLTEEELAFLHADAESFEMDEAGKKFQEALK